MKNITADEDFPVPPEQEWLKELLDSQLDQLKSIHGKLKGINSKLEFFVVLTIIAIIFSLFSLLIRF